MPPAAAVIASRLCRPEPDAGLEKKISRACEPHHLRLARTLLGLPVFRVGTTQATKEDEMIEFFDPFSADLPVGIFCLSSLTFLLLYAAAFVFMQKWGLATRLYRHVISGAGAALAALAVAFMLHATVGTSASATEGNSLSPLELHRAVGTKQLRPMEIDDRTFVYPNRE
jgi:hypothetical protein